MDEYTLLSAETLGRNDARTGEATPDISTILFNLGLRDRGDTSKIVMQAYLKGRKSFLQFAPNKQPAVETIGYAVIADNSVHDEAVDIRLLNEGKRFTPLNDNLAVTITKGKT